jgi:transcriptional regulator
MYIPVHFSETDMTEIRSMVDCFPLGCCIAHDGHSFEINHLPMMWVDNSLIGHIALANDMHRTLENGSGAAFVFQAENSYISPNWYPSKHQTHQQVPTWNYQVVHMYGRLFFEHDVKTKRAVVGQLTKLHEQKTDQSREWKMRDAPSEYINAKLAEIVAIQFDIDRIEAKAKLGQNKAQSDFESVKNQMQSRGKVGLATRMETWPKNAE